MFRKKKPGIDINDIAAFFRELVSRSKEFLGRSVRVHFVVDFVPGKSRRPSGLVDFLPFLRTVLFDETQNTVPNTDTSLYVHTAAEGSAGKIAAAIVETIQADGSEAEGGDEFFVISWGKSGMRKDIIKEFSGLSETGRKRVTLFFLPLDVGTRAEMNALAAAVRILLKGESITPGRDGLRILQGKT
jgi:hypothetical protein